MTAARVWLDYWRASAPAAPAAFIKTRKAFCDQHRAQALAAARQYAQFAAITIFIAVYALQRERARIDELVQPPCCRGTARRLCCALRLMGFGGIDIGDADLTPAIPERIAINDAVRGPAAFAQAE